MLTTLLEAVCDKCDRRCRPAPGRDITLREFRALLQESGWRLGAGKKSETHCPNCTARNSLIPAEPAAPTHSVEQSVPPDCCPCHPAESRPALPGRGFCAECIAALSACGISEQFYRKGENYATHQAPT